MSSKQLPKFKVNKPYVYEFPTVYKGSQFEPSNLKIYLDHERNPFDLDYSMIQINTKALPPWLKEPFNYAFRSVFSTLRESERVDRLFLELPSQKRLTTLQALPGSLRPLWFLLCVLLSDSNNFPLTKDFRFVPAKNAVFYCLIEKHYLSDAPCGCMEKAGIDFLFHWEAKNRHFEVCPDLNDKRIKFPRHHYYFVWRTPFPGVEELTMSLQLNLSDHLFKWDEIYAHHGSPGMRFFESRSYRISSPAQLFWYFDSKKYQSYNVSTKRARGDFFV